MVTVDAVLALHAGLTGCPVEALFTLAHAHAVHSVQADAVSKADVFSFPRAGLALGAEEARTAFSCLKRKAEAGPFLLLVLSSRGAEIPWRDWLCALGLHHTAEGLRGPP